MVPRYHPRADLDIGAKSLLLRDLLRRVSTPTRQSEDQNPSLAQKPWLVP
jgi:hypothetical protein